MTKDEIKEMVSSLFPAVSYEETNEFLAVIAAPADFRKLMKALRNNTDFTFNYLFCLTCIDWKTHLMMVYHLMSRIHNHTIVVKVKIDDVKLPAIDTVSDIWKTANFHEREVFDLFGVQFRNHPDMRRILLDDAWDGYPLRKNYVDENMIEI